MLLATSKKRQFMLKLNLTMTRIINLQQRSRVQVFKKKNQIKYIHRCILNGIQQMRKAILFDKDLSLQFKEVINDLNQVMTVKQYIITDVARMFIQLPLFVHSVNLVRWYAAHRNEGEYNKDTYVSAMDQVKAIMNEQGQLRFRGSKLCPQLVDLLRALEAVENEDQPAYKKKDTAKLLPSLDQPLYDEKEEKEKEKKR